MLKIKYIIFAKINVFFPFLFIGFSNKVCPSAMKVLQFLLRYSLWQCVHDTANNNFTPAKKDYGCAGTFLNFTYENEVFDNDYS